MQLMSLLSSDPIIKGDEIYVSGKKGDKNATWYFTASQILKVCSISTARPNYVSDNYHLIGNLPDEFYFHYTDAPHELFDLFWMDHQ
jgi:hypothetical protein